MGGPARQAPSTAPLGLPRCSPGARACLFCAEMPPCGQTEVIGHLLRAAEKCLLSLSHSGVMNLRSLLVRILSCCRLETCLHGDPRSHLLLAVSQATPQLLEAKPPYLLRLVSVVHLSASRRFFRSAAVRVQVLCLLVGPRPLVHAEVS